MLEDSRLGQACILTGRNSREEVGQPAGGLGRGKGNETDPWSPVAEPSWAKAQQIQAAKPCFLTEGNGYSCGLWGQGDEWAR